MNHELAHKLTNPIINNLDKSKIDQLNQIQLELLSFIENVPTTILDYDSDIRSRIMYAYGSVDELFAVLLAEYDVRQAVDKEILEQIREFVETVIISKEGNNESSTRTNQSTIQGKTGSGLSRNDNGTEAEIISSQDNTRNNGGAAYNERLNQTKTDAGIVENPHTWLEDRINNLLKTSEINPAQLELMQYIFRRVQERDQHRKRKK